MVRHGLTYDFNRENSYDQPKSNEKFAGLIQSVCKAYRTCTLSAEVKIEGLLPIPEYPYEPGGCPWRHIPKISCCRGDVTCQICDMVCMSYPPAQVLTLTDVEMPCIKLGDRVIIAQFRDELRFQQNLTKGLIPVLRSGGYERVMCPPEFLTTSHALCYDEYQYEMIECFVSKGADVKDPEIYNFFMKEDKEMDICHDAFLGCKRILTLKTYNRLKGTGFDMNENSFVIIDESDKRTKYIPLEVRRAREQLDAGSALCHIEEIQLMVLNIVENADGDEPVTLSKVRFMLQDWLDIDLSDRIPELWDLFPGLFSRLSSMR